MLCNYYIILFKNFVTIYFLVNSEASEQEIELLIENKTTKLFVDNVSKERIIQTTKSSV